MGEKTFKVLASCQIEACAEGTSYRLDMLRWWNGKPICETCFDEISIQYEKEFRWPDLKPLKIEQGRP